MGDDSDRIARVVGLLREDHERQGYLTLDDVLVVIARLRLESSEEVAVRKSLSEAGIEVQEPDLENVTGPVALSGKSSGQRIPYPEQLELVRLVQAGLRAQVQLENETVGLGAGVEEIILRGRAARNRLIEANLGLVGFVTKMFRGTQTLDSDDLFNEGVIGLHRAVERFEPLVGTKFSTYAVFWIRQAIQRACENQERTIRIPVHALAVLRRARQVRRALAREGRTPTTAEVADQIGVEVEKLLFLEHIARDPVSVDEAVDSSRGSPSTFVSSPDPSPEDCLLAQEERKVAREAAAALTTREHEVLALRFGLAGGAVDGATLEEIGEQFGVTRERIRQIQENALEKLRRPTISNPLTPYINARAKDERS